MERLKNFRSIRGGIATVVSEIEAGTSAGIVRMLPSLNVWYSTCVQVGTR